MIWSNSKKLFVIIFMLFQVAAGNVMANDTISGKGVFCSCMQGNICNDFVPYGVGYLFVDQTEIRQFSFSNHLDKISINMDVLQTEFTTSADQITWKGVKPPNGEQWAWALNRKNLTLRLIRKKPDEPPLSQKISGFECRVFGTVDAFLEEATRLEAEFQKSYNDALKGNKL